MRKFELFRKNWKVCVLQDCLHSLFLSKSHFTFCIIIATNYNLNITNIGFENFGNFLTIYQVISIALILILSIKDTTLLFTNLLSIEQPFSRYLRIFDHIEVHFSRLTAIRNKHTITKLLNFVFLPILFKFNITLIICEG